MSSGISKSKHTAPSTKDDEPPVVSLDSPFLALAERGYRYQKHTISIPDRYGFFSAGPPNEQVRQGILFVLLFITVLLQIGLGASVAIVNARRSDTRPFWPLPVVCSLLDGGLVALIWISECGKRGRENDCDLKDGEKTN
ncbi:hypothetical protein GLAREA_07212 [Glarea lozoyensis ATCC 20868]|uniref:Uncharacterized protein n=1 Tax=Glarea lozoyensis (strain ATCC 20868 / MF5171) TaxID=1116229 RepID=S3DAQ7_GLAL2|nr:uncharacterized protein GLAREA_07212 [Glarea lozoyensis ATCC 20868]EPE34199.1 hypothetical protein GLAREA_07212 [Glarea lozoyensis ATCC 20868]